MTSELVRELVDRHTPPDVIVEVVQKVTDITEPPRMYRVEFRNPDQKRTPSVVTERALGSTLATMLAYAYAAKCGVQVQKL